jgi:hypothetical protein
VGVVARDLRLLKHFREVPRDLPQFFSPGPLDALVLPGVDFPALFERLVKRDENADTYFSCLATLHKARLKHERILQAQPVPTIDQVGPRGLLQYGTLAPKALTLFLLWRKWIYDIDNRAGQETGYVFEPIIARAIGGVSVGSKKSPVRRQSNKQKGRQVDCIRETKAYEIKRRVTIAASGQGRWKEELDFPTDCKSSGFVPVLVVLDATPNPKLEELKTKVPRRGRRGLHRGGRLEALRLPRRQDHEPLPPALRPPPDPGTPEASAGRDRGIAGDAPSRCGKASSLCPSSARR